MLKIPFVDYTAHLIMAPCKTSSSLQPSQTTIAGDCFTPLTTIRKTGTKHDNQYQQKPPPTIKKIKTHPTTHTEFPFKNHFQNLLVPNDWWLNNLHDFRPWCIPAPVAHSSHDGPVNLHAPKERSADHGPRFPAAESLKSTFKTQWINITTYHHIMIYHVSLLYCVKVTYIGGST